ncbi:carboxymuconolactone decarboxylase family protein [Actimicrobium antarcticum]|uniref:Carboxymuconolactone decarboxylase family protein n=1 Tax=Actimicrobium antarcticum TaxID=1051899 RepID=A0ABP7STD2_9BURK
MARIPYADPSNPEIAEQAAQIAAERGGSVINLYKMLLQSPPVADGWRQLLTAIRQQCLLSAKYRELAIMRIAVLNEADYEFAQHVPFALKEGYTKQQLAALKTAEYRDYFDALDLQVIDYTDAMTLDIRVPKALFDAVKAHFSDREMVELTATIAAYNMVSRFLEALQLDHDN